MAVLLLEEEVEEEEEYDGILFMVVIIIHKLCGRRASELQVLVKWAWSNFRTNNLCALC